MSREEMLLCDFARIYAAAREGDDGQCCAVAPHPDLRERIRSAMRTLRAGAGLPSAFMLKAAEPVAFGLNDGVIVPPEEFPLGAPLRMIRAAAAKRPPLRGKLQVIVVLVDFSDQPMRQSKAHFQDLFFSLKKLPTKSVREYYHEVTHNLIDLQGDVVGPFRMPQTLAAYAHGASGMSTVHGATQCPNHGERCADCGRSIGELHTIRQ
jgi:immune inhibitor A